jgi:hypothetical protein
MKKPQQAHLNRIRKQFDGLVTRKYKKGQREHGGDMWLKKGMLDEAINEVVDLVVYLLTLKEQNEQANRH